MIFFNSNNVARSMRRNRRNSNRIMMSPDNNNSDDNNNNGNDDEVTNTTLLHSVGVNNSNNTRDNNIDTIANETTSLLYHDDVEQGHTNNSIANQESNLEEEQTQTYSDNNNVPQLTTTQNTNNNNDNDNIPDLDEEIRIVTNRLRILFITLTYPILPLAFILILLVIELITAAANSPSCGPNHPLKLFAFYALCMSLYAPNHRSMRRWLFNYESGSNNGGVRPRAVRVYDQCFHFLSIMFIYSGMALLKGCQDDLVQTAVQIVGGDEDGSGIIATTDLDEGVPSSATTTESICSITCPDIYDSMTRFVFVLKIFFIVLILPLVCLPCVFLWIQRRIRTEEAWARFGRAVGDIDGVEENDVDVSDIMDGLLGVVLVMVRNNGNVDVAKKVKIIEKYSNRDEESGESKGFNVSDVVGDEQNAKIRDLDNVKDCAICLRDFPIAETFDIDNDNVHVNKAMTKASSTTNPQEFNDTTTDNDVVMTKCGHLFHRKCVGSWIAGSWDDESNTPPSGRAKRTTCPICRKDLAPDDA